MFLRSSPFDVHVSYVGAAGVLNLSGTSPCCWYINEDIPDVNAFRAGYVSRYRYVPGSVCFQRIFWVLALSSPSCRFGE